MSAEVYESAERTFLTPKGATDVEKSNVPSLDEFDNEIDIYRVSRTVLFEVRLDGERGWGVGGGEGSIALKFALGRYWFSSVLLLGGGGGGGC